MLTCCCFFLSLVASLASDFTFSPGSESWSDSVSDSRDDTDITSFESRDSRSLFSYRKLLAREIRLYLSHFPYNHVGLGVGAW